MNRNFSTKRFFKTHDYEDMKMTEFLMMTLTPQLRKTAKKRASQPSSIRELNMDFGS